MREPSSPVKVRAAKNETCDWRQVIPNDLRHADGVSGSSGCVFCNFPKTGKNERERRPLLHFACSAAAISVV